MAGAGELNGAGDKLTGDKLAGDMSAGGGLAGDRLGGDGPTDDRPIGKRLKELRLDQGLSQHVMAEPSYTRAYLTMIEAGRAKATDEALHHFADRLRLGRTLGETMAAAHRARHRGEPEEAGATFERVAAGAEAFALTDLAQAALRGQGEVAIQLGQLDRAISLFAQAGDTCREVTCRALAGDPVGAVALGEEALGRADRGDHVFLSRLHAALIMPFAQIGAFGRVGAAARQALHLSSRLDDPELLGYVHRAVTHAYTEQRQFNEAMLHADEALRLCEQLGQTIDAGLCRLARGCILMEEERLPESADELTLAIEAFTSSRAIVYRARAAAVLAGLRLRQGHSEQAHLLAEELLETNDPWTDGYLHRIAGMAGSDPVEAEEHLRRSAELFSEQGGQVDLVETCREWGRMLTTQGRLVEAIDVYDRGLSGVRTLAH